MCTIKEDFLDEIKDKPTIHAACITYGSDWANNQKKVFLKIGYSPIDYDVFLSQIDIEFDGGFGSQEVFGYTWYDDGTWSERHEYDGSEWWEYKKTPDIPKECI